MTDDAAVVRLGAWSYRGGRRTRRNKANPQRQVRKLRDAAETQAKSKGEFLRIAPPAELLERPDELRPGQEWGLWVLDDALYEHLAVIGVRNGIVVAQTEDGQLLAVEQGQLLRRGHFLGWVR